MEMELFFFCQELCEKNLLECRTARKPREIGLFDDVFAREARDPFEEEPLSFCYGVDERKEYSFFPTSATLQHLVSLFHCSV